ncbi:MAG: DUF3237 family protein, partial [Burkholderiales bacterium]
AEDSARSRRGEPVDPSRVYFRCQPRFKTGDARWAWLHERPFVGRGGRRPDAVHLAFWQGLCPGAASGPRSAGRRAGRCLPVSSWASSCRTSRPRRAGC